LKTLGLQVIMAQAGLPVPAGEGSRLAPFDALWSVIGDEQDLSRGLSTFSGHLERIARILQDAGPRTLVLLDELAADTEPRHGAALAIALLQALVEKGACVVVTTHFEELKTLAGPSPAFANASVGFDLARLEPTFVLHPDVPGRSLTLDIARRLGVPEGVLQRAEGLLEAPEHQIDALLLSLEQEKEAVRALREDLRRQTAEAEAARQRHASAATQAENTRRELLGKGKESLLSEIQAVRRQVAETVEALKRGPSMRQAVAASEELKRLDEGVRRTDAPPAPAPAPSTVREPQPGDRVRVLTLDKIGEVLSVDRRVGMVSVRLGALQTRAAFEQVEVVSGGAPAAGEPAARAGSAKLSRVLAQAPEAVRPAPAPEPDVCRTPDTTLDLRGLRAEEAIVAVERFLDRLFGEGRDGAFLIHGHGTGALKQAVREYLRTSPYPRSFRTGTHEEGGDGVTVVRLK
jgi:DNA mismatch repair protein MutS2